MTHRLLPLLLLLSTACIGAKADAPPSAATAAQPVEATFTSAKTPAPTGAMAPAAWAAPASCPMAAAFTAKIDKKAIGACECWTADSQLCLAPSGTALLYCRAPAEQKPTCEVSANWSPPTQQSSSPPEAAPGTGSGSAAAAPRPGNGK